MWTVEDWYDEARASAELNAAVMRANAEMCLQMLVEADPEWTRDECILELKKWNQERLDAVPDLTRYPELRGVRELVEARWRGWRDGVQMNDAQWASYCGWFSYYQRFLRRPGRARCSCVYFPSSDRGPLFASNLDSSPSEAFGPPGWVAGEHFVTGSVSSGVYLDELSPEIFPAPVHDLVNHHCTTTDEGVAMFTRYNLFWGPCNFILVDRGHNVAMIEKSACRIGVRRSPDGFGFVTAMTAEETSMKAFLADRRAASISARNLPPGNIDEVYWAKQDKRRELMNELLDEARKAPTLNGLRSLVQFRSEDRGNVAGNGERYLPDGPESEYTLCTTIWVLSEGRVLWWAREGDTPSWENRKEDLCFENVPLWT